MRVVGWMAPPQLRVRSVVAMVQPGCARFFSGQAKPVTPHPDRVHLKECKRVVIKVGTAVVSSANGNLVRVILSSEQVVVSC